MGDDVVYWTDHLNLARRLSPENLPSYEQKKQTSNTDWLENSDLWDEVFDDISAAKFKFTVKWVNSHAADWEEIAPHISEDVYQGNDEADKAAKAAAKGHQVPKSVVDELAAQHEKTKLILRRLVAIACDEATGPRQHKKQKQIEAKPKWCTRLQTAASATSHTIRATPGRRWLCTSCFGRSPVGNRGKHRWLLVGCGDEEIACSQPHPSHHMLWVAGSTVTFCSRCGSWSTEVHRALGLPCLREPSTALQRLCLRRIARGTGPPGLDLCLDAAAEADDAQRGDELFVEGLDHSDSE